MATKVKAYQGGMPAGAILPYGGTTSPAGYLLCNGASVLRADYPELFTAIGTAYGTADGTHFNVPDLRGYFLRGVDGATGRDTGAGARTALKTGGNTGDNVGSFQDDQFQGHSHMVPDNENAGTDVGVTYSLNRGNSSIFAQGIGTLGSYGSPKVGSETRSKNVSVNYIIKY